MIVNHILSFVVFLFSNVPVLSFESYEEGKCCIDNSEKEDAWDCSPQSFEPRVCSTNVGFKKFGYKCCYESDGASCAGKSRGDVCYNTVTNGGEKKSGGTCMAGWCERRTWIDQHYGIVLMMAPPVLIFCGGCWFWLWLWKTHLNIKCCCPSVNCCRRRPSVNFCRRHPSVNTAKVAAMQFPNLVSVKKSDLHVGQHVKAKYGPKFWNAIITNINTDSSGVNTYDLEWAAEDGGGFKKNVTTENIRLDPSRLVAVKDSDLFVGQRVKALHGTAFWEATITNINTDPSDAKAYDLEWAAEAGGGFRCNVPTKEIRDDPHHQMSVYYSDLRVGQRVKALHGTAFWDATITNINTDPSGAKAYDLEWAAKAGGGFRCNVPTKEIRINLSHLVQVEHSDLHVGQRVKTGWELEANLFRDATITKINTNDTYDLEYLDWAVEGGGGYTGNVPIKDIWLDPSHLVAVEDSDLHVDQRVKARCEAIFYDATITQINKDPSGAKTYDLKWGAGVVGGGFQYKVPAQKIKLAPPRPASTQAMASAQVIPLNDPTLHTVIAAPVEMPIAEAKIEVISADPTPIVYPVNETKTHVVSTFDNLSSWLAALNMSQYQKAFEDDGYDEEEIIAHLTKEDILAIEGMKKGHANKIYRAIALLKS